MSSTGTSTGWVARPARGPGSAAGQRLRAPFQWGNSSARRLWLGVDVVALAVMLSLLGLALWPTYGVGWLWVCVFGGGAVGVGIALLSWRFRMGPLVTSVVTLVAWLLFGPALAMPSATIGHLIPTQRSIIAMLRAPVTSWKQMLTLTPPIGETGNLLAVPLILALMTTLLGLAISLRTARPALAWVPGCAAIVVAWGVGTTTTVAPRWTGIALVALIVVWTSYRRANLRQSLVQQRRRFRVGTAGAGAVVLAVLTAVTVAAAPLVQPDGPRRVIRHTVAPPLDINNYPSPLQGFRGLMDQRRDEVVFSIYGVPAGAVIELATLDVWSGNTYVISTSASGEAQEGRFERIGARVKTPLKGVASTVQVRVSDLNGVWVPMVGQLSSMTFEGERRVGLADSLFYNAATTTAIEAIGLAPGDSYSMAVVVPDQPSAAAVKAAAAGAVNQPDGDTPPDSVRDLATKWSAGSATSGEALQRIAARLQQGYYSNGLPNQAASLSGHSFARIEALLATPEKMVGDEEQYAVAMALMARAIGVPARVVYGFEVPDGGSGDVRGADVRAWTEANLEGLGWVRFNPTPSHDRELTTPITQNPPEARPHVEDPPPDPQRPEQVPPDTESEVSPPQDDPAEPPFNWQRAALWFLLIGIPLVTLVLPPLLILIAKSMRRRRRLRTGSPDQRVGGAWSELVDRARDLGRTPTPTATRTEQAELMAVNFPQMVTTSDPIALAMRADAAIFSPDPESAEDAQAYWEQISDAEKGMRQAVGRRRWWRARLSTRSFRRYVGRGATATTT